MEAILIFQQPDERGTRLILERLGQPDCIVVTAPGIQLSQAIPSAQVLPAGVASEANADLLRQIHLFGDTRIGDKTIGQLFNPGNLPLWHYQRFRIFFELRTAFMARSAVRFYHLQGRKVVAYCNHGLARALSTMEEPPEILPAPSDAKPGLNTGKVVGYFILFVTRIFLSLIRRPSLSDRRHAVVDRSLRQLCREAQSLKPKADNYTLSNLLDALDDEFLIITETEPPKLRGKTMFRLSRHLWSFHGRGSKTIYGEYILARGLLSPALYRQRREMSSLIAAAAGQLSIISSSAEQQLILNAFVRLMPTNRYFIIRFLAYQLFFSKSGIKTITAIDENSPSTRCILDAARSQGAKTIGIQHGNIGNAQPAYLYTPTDREQKIMADYTLVWGSGWKDFLIREGNYPEDSLIVTGQLRTDTIPQLLKTPPAVPGITSRDVPVALFASQPIPDPMMRYRAAYDVFSAFSKLKGVELHVKLHPAEKNDADYYRGIAGEAGCKLFRIVHDVDLYDYLAVSRLVITCYSTVGTEAIYFGRPLIILDHNRDDLLGYHASGVAWQATDAESLFKMVEGILNGDLKVDEEAYVRFISKSAYSIDGRVTQRTLSAIRQAGC